MPDIHGLNKKSFNYHNLSDRPVGYFIRLTSKVLPGVRSVQDQVVPYAESWRQANLAAIKESGPLWVALGDSMSQGIGASAYNRGYVGQLQQLLNGVGKHYRLINLSVSGCRVSDVVDRQLPALQQLHEQPALVTLLIGSNDMVSRKYRKYLVQNYTELLEQLPRGSVIASPFSNFGLGRLLNNLLKHKAKQQGFTLVGNDLSNGTSSWKGKLAADHFHPNDAGYSGLAQMFFKAIGH